MSRCRIPSKYIFQRLHTDSAFRVLEKRKLLDDKVYMGDATRHTTPRLLLARCSCFLARDIGPLKFLGGPPGHYKWYQGSLLTVVLDAVFQDRAEEARCGSNT